ncbi:MAG TPA: Smr/MutS family protein [Vicinamibacteria bacterium]|nr:Smr/MutS family protein [Vicinamibacteria bacterium]
MSDPTGDGPEDEPPDTVEIPVTGELDLHPFAPKDIPSVVVEYVRACRARGILSVRLAHGRGTGVQRAVVRRVLRAMPEVVSFADALPAAGGWGATVATLAPPR